MVAEFTYLTELSWLSLLLLLGVIIALLFWFAILRSLKLYSWKAGKGTYVPSH